MKELAQMFDLKLHTDTSKVFEVKVYSCEIKGLFISNYDFYNDKKINDKSVFIFFKRKSFRYYTTWPLELAVSHSKKSFYEWFKFVIKRRYRQALRSQTQL